MEIKFLNWRVSFERVFFDEAKLSGLYNDVAEQWEKSIKRMGYLQAYDALFAEMDDDGYLDNLDANSCTMDAGIGTGALSKAFLRYRPNVNLHAIDISPQMLQVAKQNLGDSAIYRESSITELPYADKQFDFVISAHALEHLPNPALGFSELIRVLKPHHRFVIVATRICLATRILSLKWNFKPMTETSVVRMLEDAGAQQVSYQALTNKRHMTQMSLIYTGIKG